MTPLHPIALIFSLLFTGLTGCVSANSQANEQIAQVIVKFKAANDQPASPALLQDLGQTAKLKVSHLRPMSGGAQIYLLTGFADDAELAQALKQLSARSDIEYAELDQKMKPQKKSQ